MSFVQQGSIEIRKAVLSWRTGISLIISSKHFTKPTFICLTQKVKSV